MFHCVVIFSTSVGVGDIVFIQSVRCEGDPPFAGVVFTFFEHRLLSPRFVHGWLASFSLIKKTILCEFNRSVSYNYNGGLLIPP